MRILFDTNVWLAILVTDGHCRQYWKAARNHCQIFASADVFSEIKEKLRGKFGFSLRHARLLTRFVRQQTAVVEATLPLPVVCRDVADNRILAAAMAGRCEKLVTGDNDLLVLKEFKGVAIISPGDF